MSLCRGAHNQRRLASSFWPESYSEALRPRLNPTALYLHPASQTRTSSAHYHHQTPLLLFGRMPGKYDARSHCRMALEQARPVHNPAPQVLNACSLAPSGSDFSAGQVYEDWLKNLAACPVIWKLEIRLPCGTKYQARPVS